MALAGRIALVTGAASGLGRATALRFANAGARVLLLDLPSAQPALETLHRALPPQASAFHPADVTSESDVRSAPAGARPCRWSPSVRAC